MLLYLGRNAFVTMPAIDPYAPQTAQATAMSLRRGTGGTPDLGSQLFGGFLGVRSCLGREHS